MTALRCTVGGSIAVTSAPDDLVDRMRHRLSFSNPEYTRALRADRATSGIPERIYVTNETQGALIVPRGAVEVLKAVAAERSYELEWTDQRELGSPISARDGLPELRDYQEQAVDRAARRVQGTVILPPGGGKTTIGAAIIARIGRSALVIVHTEELLDQWCETLRSRLRIEAGRIQRGTARFGSVGVTVAIVNTLDDALGALPGLARAWGTVIVDECVRGDVLVDLRDGTSVPISEIRVGDELAVGGRVLRTARRWYEGYFTTIGRAVVTEEHPVATASGWRRAVEITNDDYIWSQEGLLDLWEAPTQSQSYWSMQRSQGDVRSRYGSLSLVRESCADNPPRLSCEHEVRDHRDVARGSRSGPGEESLDDTGREKFLPRKDVWQPLRDDAARLARKARRDACCSVRGSVSKIPATGGDRASAEALHATSAATINQSIWWPWTRQWCGENSGRARDGTQTCGTWLSVGVRTSDGIRISTEALQNRSRRADDEGRSGTRRQQPRSLEKSSGRTEDFVPSVAWLARDPEALARGLRPRRLGVYRSRVRSACYVYNLETEHGIYVAGGVVVHNCHFAPAATFQRVIGKLPARYRFGLTATPEREDGYGPLVDWSFGERLIECDARELVRRGFLTAPRVRAVATEFEFDVAAVPEHLRMSRLQAALVMDAKRTDLVARLAREEAASGELVLVLSNSIEHCEAISARLNGSEHAVVTSRTRKIERRQRVSDFREGRLPILLATSLADHGVDWPQLSRVVLALPGSSRGRTIQRLGRLMRNYPGKRPVLIDVVDERVPTLANRWQSRRRVYRKIDLEITEAR